MGWLMEWWHFPKPCLIFCHKPWFCFFTMAFNDWMRIPRPLFTFQIFNYRLVNTRKNLWTARQYGICLQYVYIYIYVYIYTYIYIYIYIVYIYIYIHIYRHVYFTTINSMFGSVGNIKVFVRRNCHGKHPD